MTFIHFPGFDTLTASDYIVGGVGVVVALIIIIGLITIIRKS